MENIIQAFSISFLHSIWQGLIIGIIAIVFLYTSKNLSSSFRYRFLCLLLLMFIFSFGYTLYVEILNSQEKIFSVLTNPNIATLPLSEYSVTDWKITLLDWCAHHSNTIMMIWSFVFVLKFVITMRSLYLLERLKQYSNPVTGYWVSGIKQLAKQLNLQMKISLRESSQINQPIMIGIFKPVVLFPIGLINHLSVSEVEAILLHELAHIKRADYFVNLLQHLVETVFFFNPALLWLSKQIRKEREYCCDEIAVQYSGKKNFMKALVSFHEHQSNHLNYAMAFSSKKSLFRMRIERIIQIKKNGNSIKLCFSLIGIVCAFGLLSHSASVNTNIDQVSKHPAYTNSPLKTNNTALDSDKEAIKEKPVLLTKIFLKNKSPKAKEKITVVKDTIPPGASKDFIAGYKAGISYKANSTAPDKFSIEKILREKQAIKQIKDKENAFHNDFLKKEIEEKLRRELKDKD